MTVLSIAYLFAGLNAIAYTVLALILARLAGDGYFVMVGVGIVNVAVCAYAIVTCRS